MVDDFGSTKGNLHSHNSGDSTSSSGSFPKRILTAIAFIALLSIAPLSLAAQKGAIKTNIINDAFLSPNLAIEAGIAPKWTAEIDAEINAWSVGDKNWRHWFVMPEARYWFCRSFSGHFVGAHILGGQYNLSLIHI